MLHTIRHEGPPRSVPLIIAHGLFGSARNFAGIARKLSETRTVITVDMRNHGQSPWNDSHSYPELAEDLAQVLAKEGRADLMGHSMGGKASMMLALTKPQGLRRLIVADIAPVIYTHSQTSNIDAMESIDLTQISRRSEAEKQLVAQSVDPGNAGFFTQSLDLTNHRWRFNLAVLRKDMDKLIGFPEVTTQFDGPALFLSGGASDYVRPEHRARIKALFPKAMLAKLPGAGHNLHAEKPAEFLAAVTAFLNAGDDQAV